MLFEFARSLPEVTRKLLKRPCFNLFASFVCDERGKVNKTKIMTAEAYISLVLSVSLPKCGCVEQDNFCAGNSTTRKSMKKE
jgi:hypothetical protein